MAGFQAFRGVSDLGSTGWGLSESDSSRISSSGFRNEGLAGPWLVGSGPLCLGRWPCRLCFGGEGLVMGILSSGSGV